MEIFDRHGLTGLLIIAHAVAAVMWMGLLWFFNFVQTPAYAEMDGAARNNAFDKLTWRALWWFRWAAAATVAFGLLVIALGGSDWFDGDFWKSTPGVTLLIGILFGVTMLYNVWMIIWPNQQIVIANARNVQAGGEADPEAASAGRRALLASRMNMIFSLPMLVFMVGASHFPYDVDAVAPTGSSRAIFWIIWVVVWAALELTALGYLGGFAPGGPRAIFDNHKNALWAGFVYAAFALLLFTFVIKS